MSKQPAVLGRGTCPQRESGHVQALRWKHLDTSANLPRDSSCFTAHPVGLFLSPACWSPQPRRGPAGGGGGSIAFRTCTTGTLPCLPRRCSHEAFWLNAEQCGFLRELALFYKLLMPNLSETKIKSYWGRINHNFIRSQLLLEKTECVWLCVTLVWW